MASLESLSSLYLPLPRPEMLPLAAIEDALYARPKPLLRAGKHPTLPLTIYNYTDAAQFQNVWNEITLAARGIVLENNTGKVIARPFPKFFNYDVNKHEHMQELDYEVTEKVDGSLGIYFFYKGDWIFASRGSFTSDQAKAGNELAKAAKLCGICNPSFTYVFETVYPKGRVVIDYGGTSELVFLGKIRTTTGEESPLDLPSGLPGIRLAKRFPKESFQQLLAHNTANAEGYVLVFPSGERLKLKFEQYKYLDRGRSRFSPSIVVRWLKKDITDTTLNHAGQIPDEFHAEAREIERKVRESYIARKEKIMSMMNMYKTFESQSIPKSENKNVVCRALKVQRDGENWREIIENDIWIRIQTQFAPREKATWKPPKAERQ